MSNPKDGSSTHGRIPKENCNGDAETKEEQHQSESERDALVKQNHSTTAKFMAVGILRWLGTAVLAVLFYVIILLHQDRTLTSGQKSTFDALVVAVSLALGLNSAASLRHIAVYANRWFKGGQDVKLKEVLYRFYTSALRQGG